MKKIRLSSWITCIVDDEDFDYLNQWKWSGWEYAKRKDKELGIIISMHRIIMGAKHGDIIDHINGNKLDNRKENLRFCTARENSQNLEHNHKVGYKGVYRQYNKCGGCYYIVKITVHGKTINLGKFSSQTEAGKTYDKAAKKYFGEFARLNFPEK